MDISVEAAQELAGSLLGVGTDRWRHSRTAGRAAAEVAATVPAQDRELLVASAWVHDIGYVHPRPPTGFHPIDGAHLLTEAGWPGRVAALVAHHSEARFAAAALSLGHEIGLFHREDGPVVDALIYADSTAGPDGRRLRLGERVEDIHRRHADEPSALREARLRREPFIRLACARVDLRARRLGLAHYEALPVSRHRADADLVAGLVAVNPDRDLDVRAALHAVTSSAPTRLTQAALRHQAVELLASTRPHPSPRVPLEREAAGRPTAPSA